MHEDANVRHGLVGTPSVPLDASTDGIVQRVVEAQVGGAECLVCARVLWVAVAAIMLQATAKHLLES